MTITQEDREAAHRWMGALPRADFDKLLLLLREREAAVCAAQRRQIVGLLRNPTPELWDALWAASEDYFIADKVSTDGLRLALAAVADRLDEK